MARPYNYSLAILHVGPNIKYFLPLCLCLPSMWILFTDDDAFILSLTKKITFDQAERLGICLNVSSNHIDALKKIKDPNLFATKVVIKWRNNFTGSENEACEALSVALEKCNLMKESRAVSALVQGRAYVAGEYKGMFVIDALYIIIITMYDANKA